MFCWCEHTWANSEDSILLILLKCFSEHKLFNISRKCILPLKNTNQQEKWVGWNKNDGRFLRRGKEKKSVSPAVSFGVLKNRSESDSRTAWQFLRSLFLLSPRCCLPFPLLLFPFDILKVSRALKREEKEKETPNQPKHSSPPLLFLSPHTHTHTPFSQKRQENHNGI